jgi:predicted phosphoadenosine phosphosulfate sulfurtransferase
LALVGLGRRPGNPMALKYFLDRNVLEVAQERVRFLFDEFETIIVTISGGKDSAVILDLMLREATARGRLPLKVMFLDQEAEWQATIDEIRAVMYRPDIEPYWLQVPFKLTNATSTTEGWLYCWSAEEEHRWMRPREPIALTENVYGTDRFKKLFTAFIKVHFKGQKACLISGVRTEESQSRMLGLTSHATYKGMTWGKVETKGLQYSLYPIFDWSWTDVWKYIHDHRLRYNRIYDFQFIKGVSPREMRVSSLHHETSLAHAFDLQEFEPATYARLTQRIGGIDMAGKMGFADFYVYKLPPMFRSWAEYRDYLLEHLIEPEHRDKFRHHFALQWRYYEDRGGDRVTKAQVQAILANDYELVKLVNFDNAEPQLVLRRGVEKEHRVPA